MNLDLKELERKADKALAKETTENLKEWLDRNRKTHCPECGNKLNWFESLGCRETKVAEFSYCHKGSSCDKCNDKIYNERSLLRIGDIDDKLFLFDTPKGYYEVWADSRTNAFKALLCDMHVELGS